MRTIEQIVAEVSAWGDATFPNTSVVDLLRKLDEEYHELEEAAWLYLKLRGRVDLDSLAVFRIELLDEIADNFIVLARLTKALDADFRQVIEDKWDVVKARDYSEPKTASCELLNDAIAKKEAATQVAGGPLNGVKDSILRGAE